MRLTSRAERSRLNNRIGCLLACALALAFGGKATAQGGDELVVEGARPSPPAPFEVDTRALDSFRPRDLASVAALLPGATISTNSRGQSLVTVRGRSEREPSLSIDGTDIVNPWDGAVDLARLPAGVVVSVAADAAGSPLRGLGSSVAIATAPRPEGGEILLEAGDFGAYRQAASLAGKGRLVSFERQGSDGFPRPDDAALPFSQGARRTRTNSERSQASLFARQDLSLGTASLQAMFLVSRAEYGVPPEGHLDPDKSRVRYWQVPEDDLLLAGLQARRKLGAKTSLTGRASYQAVRTTTQAFTDQTYGQVDAVERGAGHAAHGSAQLARRWERGVVRLSAGGTSLSYDEETAAATRASFVRRSGFAAVDALFDVARWDLAAGARIEAFDTLESGGRPEGSDISSWSGRSEVGYRVDDRWRLSAYGGRLARMPTQRELYGEALGRFLVNPGLVAETARTGGSRVTFAGQWVAFAADGFWERRRDTIEQRVVVTPDGTRRQRVNGEGTRAFGLEARLESNLDSPLMFLFQTTYLDIESRDGGPVPERPELAGLATIGWAPEAGLRAMLSLDHRGEAFSLAEDGGFVALEPATALHIEAGNRFRLAQGTAEIYLRVDNALDANIVPQLGLPASGRSLRGGIRWMPQAAS